MRKSILWGVFAVVFLLFMVGCNSDSSSGDKSETKTNPAEETTSGSDSADNSSGGSPPANDPSDSDADTPDSGTTNPPDSGTSDPPDEAPADETPVGGAPATGTLTVYLADATTDYQAVYVTIDRVEVNSPGSPGGWEIVAEPRATYNLLVLVNGIMAELGTTELEAGHYTGLRMILGKEPDGEPNLLEYEHRYPNYIITGDGGEIELFVPSGYQTGIKLVSGFDITAGASTELVLDFDASRSVVKAGQSGRYLLKPTIKVINAIDRADLGGTVTSTEGDGIADAFVSAQIYTEGTDDTETAVEVFTSTRTDDNGGYALFLPEGDYNIVAYKGTVETDDPGDESAEANGTPVYGPVCKRLEADYDFNYTENFTLDVQWAGTLAVSIDVEPHQTVDVSAWKWIDCDGVDVYVEIPKPLMVDVQVQSETHEMVLPQGNYIIYAATEEMALRKYDVEIEADKTTALTFNFLGTQPGEEEDEEDDEVVEP